MRLKVALVGLAIPLLWFGPELWGSGEPFRASSRAGKPNPGSAAFADHPGLEVATRFAERAVIPLQVAGFVGVIVAALAWVRHRAQGADPGPGRDRHRLDPAGGRHDRARLRGQPALPDRDHRRAVRARRDRHRPHLRRHPRRRWPSAPARAPACGWRFAVFAVGLVALSPVIKAKVENVDKTLDKLRYEASLWHTLPGVIDEAGGPTKILACGNIYSGPFQTQMVAYQLGVHGINVGDVRPLKESPGARRDLPHQHRARRAARGRRDRQALPRGQPLRALADLDRAARRRPRAQLPGRGHRRTPCPSDRAHDRAVVLALTIFP